MTRRRVKPVAVNTPVSDDGACQWYALCTNPATGTMPHPVLGNVPICERCAERVDFQRYVKYGAPF